VAEQINALLGDADAPDRWHYRSLSLLTAGDAVTSLQLAHQPVCADPQAGLVVLGPNICMDLPSDASFEFVEIRARSEISLTASQSYALLQAMAIQKASLFSTLLLHWTALTGEALDPGAGLQVTVSPLTPPIQPQPQVKEWIELFDKGVISREELRHQLALATANAISSPTLDDSPATKAGEGSHNPASSTGQPISSPAGPSQ
jgi:hypothetical protein